MDLLRRHFITNSSEGELPSDPADILNYDIVFKYKSTVRNRFMGGLLDNYSFSNSTIVVYSLCWFEYEITKVYESWDESTGTGSIGLNYNELFDPKAGYRTSLPIVSLGIITLVNGESKIVASGTLFTGNEFGVDNASRIYSLEVLCKNNVTILTSIIDPYINNVTELKLPTSIKYYGSPVQFHLNTSTDGSTGVGVTPRCSIYKYLPRLCELQDTFILPKQIEYINASGSMDGNYITNYIGISRFNNIKVEDGNKFYRVVDNCLLNIDSDTCLAVAKNCNELPMEVGYLAYGAMSYQDRDTFIIPKHVKGISVSFEYSHIKSLHHHPQTWDYEFQYATIDKLYIYDDVSSININDYPYATIGEIIHIGNIKSSNQMSELIRRHFINGNTIKSQTGDDFDLGPADYIIEYTASEAVRFSGGSWNHDSNIIYFWGADTVKVFRVVKDIYYPDQQRGIWGFQGDIPTTVGGYVGYVPSTSSDRDFDAVYLGGLNYRAQADYRILDENGEPLSEEYYSSEALETLSFKDTNIVGIDPGIGTGCFPMILNSPKFYQAYFNTDKRFRINIFAFPQYSHSPLYYDQTFLWSEKYDLYSSTECLTTIHGNNFNNIIVEENHPYLDSRDNCGAVCSKVDIDESIISDGDKDTNSIIPVNTLLLSSASTTIPNSITRLNAKAFENNERITEITIPESITHIGTQCFLGCDSLETVYFNAVHCEDLMGDMDQGFPFSCSNLKNFIIGESVEYLPQYFELGNQINNLIFPKSIKGIGEIGGTSNPHASPSALTDIYYQGTKLDWYNFSDHKNVASSITVHCLDGDYISDNIEELYPNQYIKYTSTSGEINCSNVTNANYIGTVYVNGSYYAVFDSEITSIEGYAFNSNSRLKTITLPNTVTSIGDYAFNSCDSLTNVYGLESTKITALSDYTFNECTRLTSISLPDTVTSLGRNALAYSGVRSLKLPAITEFGLGAVTGANNLTSVEFASGTTTLGHATFSGCGKLSTLIIPDTVESIGDMTLWNCNALETATFHGTSSQWAEVDTRSNSLTSSNSDVMVQCTDKLVPWLYTGGNILVTEIQANNITVDFGDPIQLQYTVLPTNADNKDVTITCDDTGVVINEDNSITVENPGEYTIVISSTDESNISKSIKLTVKEKVDPNQPIVYNKVDLGIKTSDGKTIYFADKNVGARNIEDSGLYFQWGSAKARSVDESGNVIGDPFDGQHYEYYDNSIGDFTKYDDGYSVIDPEDDGATVHMGSEWRTPTYSEFKLLLNKVKSSASDSSKPIKLVVVYHDKSTPDVKLEKPYYSSNSFINTDIINSSTYEVDGLKFINVNTNAELFLPSNGQGSETTIVTSSNGSMFYAGYWLGDNILDEETYNMGMGTDYYGRNIMYCCIYGQQNYFGSDFPLVMSRYPGLGIRGICVE